MELVAHRGANWHFPENSLDAFRRALQDGARILQIDVQRSKDDVLVVHHEARFKGHAIARTRYDILAANLPRLEDVLEAFPKIRLDINIQNADLRTVYSIVDLLREREAISRVCLSSSRLEVQRWLLDLRYEGERSLSFLEVLLIFFLPIVWLNSWKWDKRRAQVSVEQGLFVFASKFFVRKCHRLGLWVDFFVVNDRAQATRLKAIGADRLMTDDPATLLSLA